MGFITCYKVVSTVNDKYVSAWVHETPLQLEYKIGEYTKARPELLKYGNGILAFSDLEVARDFKRRFTRHGKIFIAQAPTKLKTKPVRLNWIDYTWNEILSSAENFYRYKIFLENYWSWASVIVPSIKLIREID